jgi:hypothetical protein
MLCNTCDCWLWACASGCGFVSMLTLMWCHQLQHPASSWALSGQAALLAVGCIADCTALCTLCHCAGHELLSYHDALCMHMPVGPSCSACQCRWVVTYSMHRLPATACMHPTFIQHSIPSLCQQRFFETPLTGVFRLLHCVQSPMQSLCQHILPAEAVSPRMMPSQAVALWCVGLPSPH